MTSVGRLIGDRIRRTDCRLVPVSFMFLCYLGEGEEDDVTVAYDSDNVNEAGPNGGRKSKSARSRRRRSCQVTSAASYHSVGNRSHQSDPSLRCVSVSSATQGFVSHHQL